MRSCDFFIYLHKREGIQGYDSLKCNFESGGEYRVETVAHRGGGRLQEFIGELQSNECRAEAVSSQGGTARSRVFNVWSRAIYGSSGSSAPS
ncbi:hypothetical protein EYF80_034608 [Liparis tanakae]|uniref:Uncharacterized protein n=1 Tax=Liparis tanakae TaxID=230148 RepID=A0A4Z2GQW6_9TELE|nr:hypothetical protein EYF80_034608 [Liparis tanakae]